MNLNDVIGVLLLILVILALGWVINRSDEVDSQIPRVIVGIVDEVVSTNPGGFGSRSTCTLKLTNNKSVAIFGCYDVMTGCVVYDKQGGMEKGLYVVC